MTDSTQHHDDTGSHTASGLVSPFWKYGVFVLGFGLVLSVAGKSGPATAGAGERGVNEVLQVGGFGAVGDEPGLVIVDGEGMRVGVLPRAGSK